MAIKIMKKKKASNKRFLEPPRTPRGAYLRSVKALKKILKKRGEKASATTADHGRSMATITVRGEPHVRGQGF